MDVIKIAISTPISEPGPSVSIQWEGKCLEINATSELDDVWDEGDQIWTKICNGIHAFLAELGPIPEGGWDVKFSCKNPKLILEKGLTLRKYRNHYKNID